MGLFEINHEWVVEITRRCREIDEGAVGLIPGEDVFKEAAKELQSRNTGFTKSSNRQDMNRQ